MGRYCFFNTGYEYKFTFAVQPSEDILKFGGTPTFVYEGDHKHQWSIVDRKLILNKLRDIESALQISALNFDLYEKTIRGTSALRHELFGLQTDNAELKATYTLGCILYHQLLYKLDLDCTYES